MTDLSVPTDHEEGCHYLGANPWEGDEAALCDCGYHEEKYVQWLAQQEDE